MKNFVTTPAIACFMLVALIISSCRQELSYKGKPKETITLERAHEMYQAYQARFDALTASRGGKEDARYGWHNLDFYKQYIAYLEHEAEKVNIPVSGLRLYYVAYPDDNEAGEKGGYQTYIFVPTYFNKKTNKHEAFDPLHIDAEGNPLPLHEIITTGKGRTVSALTSQGKLVKRAAETPSSVVNMSEMCQPYCN